MSHESLLKRLTIDPDMPTARYLQLAHAIHRCIESGRLAPGERLPTVRKLRDTTGLASATVVKALAELARQGTIVTRTGSGAYVSAARRPATEIILPTSGDNAPPAHSFLGQIVAGVKRGFGDPRRRCFLTHTDAAGIRADEMIGVCRARHADSLIAFDPAGTLSEALRNVAPVISSVSLGDPHDRMPIDCVASDPTEPLRALLRERLEQGQRRFVFAGVRTDDAPALTAPGNAMLQTLRRTLGEAGISPTTYFASRSDGQLTATAGDIPAGTTLVAASPRLACALERPGAPLDKIACTELAEELQTYMGRVTLLYLGIDLRAERAAHLLVERSHGGATGAPRLVRMVPQVVRANAAQGAN